MWPLFCWLQTDVGAAQAEAKAAKEKETELQRRMLDNGGLQD